MHAPYEKSPSQSKKHRAYMVGDLTWTLLIGAVVLGLYRLVDMGVLEGDKLVGAIKALTELLMAMVIAKVVMQGTYVGGQAWVDQAVRVAAIAKGLVPGMPEDRTGETKPDTEGGEAPG